MTLNERVFEQNPNLVKMYRFEGENSFHHFDLNASQVYEQDDLNYVYFSRNIKHHQYYCKKKIYKLINEDVLKGKDTIKLNRSTLIQQSLFKNLVRAIENYPIDSKLVSIEFSLSQSFETLLESNYINNRDKTNNDCRVEIVDTTKYGGGFGFYDEWLKLFNIMTYFYSYQRISKENILDFLYAYRKIITSGLRINPMDFLTYPKNSVVKVNERIFYNFSKYSIMNALEGIIENELYFSNSIFDENPQEQIKNIIKQYCIEREKILETYETEYQKTYS